MRTRRPADGRDGRALKADAEALRAWPERRQAALAQLRDAATPSRKVPRWGRQDRSTLVEIFLWEGEIGAAWEEAQAGGCSESLWRRLALARAEDRPQDTVAVYRKLVGQTVGATNNTAYEHAIELLAELEQALPAQAVDEHGAARRASSASIHRQPATSRTSRRSRST